MPAPISHPFGPWGFDSSGAVTPQYFTNAQYFTFGSPQAPATVPCSVSGAVQMPFVPLIFDDSANTWADSMLSTGALVSSLYANNGLFC